MRDWLANIEDTFYCIGSVGGPHPYPDMVRDFQQIIGKEIKQQVREKEGKPPTAVVACVGGGSNAMGAFTEFIEDKDVRLVGVEAAGKGVDTDMHGATLCKGSDGVLHGMCSKLLQDEYGQIQVSYSISAGLDYPGVGPQLAFLKESGRLENVSATDEECMKAVQKLCRAAGILPALESAHAVSQALKIASELGEDDVLVVNLSGRGDKDVHTIAEYFEVDL
jgi:tryptophan synthase beta chain